MNAATQDEASLPLIRQNLQDAISALIDPQHVQLDHGRHTWLDPLFKQIQDAVSGQTGERSGTNIRRLPFWPAAHDIHEDITSTVRSWTSDEPRSVDTEERLRGVYANTWRPQDAPQLASWTTKIDYWVLRIKEQLNPPLMVFLDDPCPLCGKEWVRRPVDGELVKQRALAIRGDDGALCGHCKTMWETPARLLVLGQMIRAQRKGAPVVTVAELIDKLSKADPDALVVTDDHDSFRYITDFDVMTVPAEVRERDHPLGPNIRQFDPKRSEGEPENVIVLSRWNQGDEAAAL